MSAPASATVATFAGSPNDTEKNSSGAPAGDWNVASFRSKSVSTETKPARFAEDDVARPRLAAGRFGAICADNQVVKAVAIDIARRAHRAAGSVTCIDAAQLEAVGAVER